MTKTSPTKLPVREFLGKYPSLMEQAYVAEKRTRYPNLAALADLAGERESETPGMITSGVDWNEVAQWWPIGVLRQAAQDGDSEGCKRLLAFFLPALDVWLPKGVLMPFRWKHGRPNETRKIYEAWLAKGRPAMQWRVCDELAEAFYPDEFAQAKSNPNLRKRLRDRVRATILRHQITASATKSAPIS